MIRRLGVEHKICSPLIGSRGRCRATRIKRSAGRLNGEVQVGLFVVRRFELLFQWLGRGAVVEGEYVVEGGGQVGVFDDGLEGLTACANTAQASQL